MPPSITHQRHKIKSPISFRHNILLLRVAFGKFKRLGGQRYASANLIREIKRLINATFEAADREGGVANVTEIAALVGLTRDDLEKLRERVKDNVAPGFAALFTSPVLLATLMEIADIAVRPDPPPDDDGVRRIAVILRPVDRRAAIREMRSVEAITGPPRLAVRIFSDPSSAKAKAYGATRVSGAPILLGNAS